MLIRPETEDDRSTIQVLNTTAFGTRTEADLVDVLREQARPVISLVAEYNHAVVGHIMFAPVALPGHPALKIMGLAPMTVAPEHRDRGIGSALVRNGLEQCRQLGFGAVVVLGHPDYYPRFGFQPAASFGIGCEYDAPSEAFMAVELQPGYLSGASGKVKYHDAFGHV